MKERWVRKLTGETYSDGYSSIDEADLRRKQRPKPFMKPVEEGKTEDFEDLISLQDSQSQLSSSEDSSIMELQQQKRLLAPL